MKHVKHNISKFELSSIESNSTEWSTTVRLDKISYINDYFVAEIKERALMSKRLSKYITSFDYFDKSLIILSVTTGGISIASFGTVLEAPVGIISAIFKLIISIFTGIVKSC